MSKGQKLEPKLRFPEFRGAEGWTGEKLGSITQKVGSGITPTGGEKNYKQSGRPFVRSQNIGWGELLLDDVVFIDEKTHNSFISTQINVIDVFLNITGASIGRSAVADTRIEGGNVNQHVCIIRVKPDELSPYFLNQYLISHDGQKQIDSFQAGGNRQGLNFEQIRSFLIPLPAVFAEQQKIAECLSSVDELMAAQARKVAALKTHKKGLMQQLFPREGETQPRLRFPEFQNAGEWEDGELGPKASKVGSGITPIGGDKNYKQAGRPFVRSQNVGWGVLLLDDAAYIDEATHATFKSTEIKVSDVLLNITGASIGRSAVADERVAGGNVNQHVCIIRTKPNELNPFFLNQFLISQRGQKQIDSFQAGGNRQGLNFAQIRSFVVPLPPTLAEQQRIASCLSSGDALITAETQKLEALKTHKKGLMQQLFPSPEEVET